MITSIDKNSLSSKFKKQTYINQKSQGQEGESGLWIEILLAQLPLDKETRLIPENQMSSENLKFEAEEEWAKLQFFISTP